MKIKKKKKHNINIAHKNRKDKRLDKKDKRKWWKKLLSFLIVCAAFCVFAAFAFLIYIVYESGEFDPNKLANQDQTIIYDSKNNVIAKLGIEKRESVTYDKLPQVLVDAIVATEDSRFFQHNGVDGARFFKASVGQVLGNSSSGGASTLTMQVVKNNLTSTKKSIIRKFQDIYIAVFFMERKYTKQEIMEFYVNDSFLGGSSVYGVEEASKYYFGKSVSDLSLPEAAIIAGMFQAPYSYDPYRFPDNTKKRMATVLKLMVRHGYITQEEADMANSIDITSLLVGSSSSENKYQGFIDTVVAEVKEKTKDDPALVSMEIHTTMDPEIQDGINKVLAGDGYTWVNDKVQAGITIIDVKSGAITAIGAGRNRTGERQLNYATQTYRQPGSTAKPIFAYGPGFEFDKFSTYQLFNDEPWSYSSGGSPGNWDGGYKGLMTLRDALAISRNIPAIKALQTVNKDVGNKKIVSFVENLGIKLRDNVAYESYAIGGLETGVTTTQMAAAYATFANGGSYIEPYTVKSITYRGTGNTTEFKVKINKDAISPSTADLMNNVLEYAARHGFSGGTSGYRGTVAAKTGTSNYDEATMRKHGLPSYAVNDLWTVAYTPQHAIALWYGYDKIDNQFFNGSGTPKDNLMAAIMKYIPVVSEPFRSSNIVASQVEFGSWPAALPSKYTPSDLIRTEYFAKGTEPQEESNRFQQLNDVTNLKANTTNDGMIKLTWDYKTLESLTEEYLRKYYSQDVFGNGTEGFVQSRLAYNRDALGGLGFRIFLKTGNGDAKEIAFVTEKSYIYKPTVSGNVTFIVKTDFRNNGSMASNGVSVNTKSTAVVEDKLVASVIGDKTVELASADSYTEKGVSVTYGKTDVTAKSKIVYVIDNSTYTSMSEVEDKVNELISTEKKITIRYQIQYSPSDNDEVLNTTASRTIELK